MIKAPKAPKEDPAVAAAREREMKRAENQRTEETQGFLLSQTVRRLRRFGRLVGGSVAGASGGNVPTTTPTGGSGFNWGGGSVASSGAIGNAALSAAFGTKSLTGTPGSGVATY